MANKNLYTETELSSSDAEYKEIQREMDSAYLKIIKVVRVENKILNTRFNSECEEIRIRKGSDVANNIKSLYHGTAAKLQHLCSEGLDERLGARGHFGQGIYFSDNPRKSHKYAESEEDPRFLLRCRVLLGEIREYPPGEQNDTLKREPVKKTEADGTIVFYDSVKGRPGHHNEFVVYEKRRVLITHVIYYTCLAKKSKRQPVVQQKPVAATKGDESSSSVSSEDEEMDGGGVDAVPVGHQRVAPVVTTAPAAVRSTTTATTAGSASRGSTLSAAQMAALANHPYQSTQAVQQQALNQLLNMKGKIPDDKYEELAQSFVKTYMAPPTLSYGNSSSNSGGGTSSTSSAVPGNK